MKINNPLKKNAFKEFADTHSLVYSANFEEDAHTVVRGITLTTAREDNYLVQGNVDGHEVQLLERETSMRKPGSELVIVKWAILRLTQTRDTNLPHIFLDGNNRYHEDLYEAIFTKFHKLVLTPATHQNSFTGQYRVFTNPETAPLLEQYIPETLTTKLSSLDHHLDYELLENGIYVYLPGGAQDLKQLETMLKAAKLISAAQGDTE